MPPPSAYPQQRSKSVLSKASSSASVPAPSTKSSKSQEVPETNIQVIIRCRRRSKGEITDNSPIIVSSNGSKSHEVTIETSAPVSSLGLVTQAPTRTYPFDLVFGPEADQSMIYHDVVSPMLDEVLMGYNCTLFAYGQTGTGKTYTMQGDLNPTPMGNPSAQAGMIPRVLFRLFHHLESSVSDYSVKVSFIELYNEELRDLLAPEMAAPYGTTQPMGMGGGTTSSHSKTAAVAAELKIFDDTGKKGVFIQGLEEVSVTSSRDALALLTKGSERRQIAATKFNDHSSRSHSVFSITVHIKEKASTSVLGAPANDELLKIGKLNLVDLAGSENIGRSGAEHQRAREAGMINQSLLTLGRVINALVDKSSHVPYRESKLTRLLQDSLGGRTKTSIIATISPSRSNLEETLSTLDYALRAKSIRNKPELNQRTSRNSLLKEYVSEIERLKADVLAAREKNGIFFSEETWNQLSKEHEMRKTEVEEGKKQVEMVECQMRSVREEFELSIAMLMKRDAELKDTKERLGWTEEELEKKLGELDVVRKALLEESVVRQAFEENEGVLDGVADGLKTVAKESVEDLEALFDKLQRRTKIFTSNTQAVQTHSKSLATETNLLSTQLSDLVKSSDQHTQKLQQEAAEFRVKEMKTLTNHSERINTQLQRVQDAINLMQEKDVLSTEALVSVQNILKETHESFKEGFGAWGESLLKTCELMCKEVETSGLTGFAAVEKALKAAATLTNTITREAREFAAAERAGALQASSLADQLVQSEVTRLREQNEMLTKMLAEERLRGQKANADLIQRVSGLLGEHTEERDKSLRESVGIVTAANTKGLEGLSSFQEGHSGLVGEMEKRSSESLVMLERRGGEGKRTRDGALKVLASSKSTFGQELKKMQEAVSGSVQSYTAQVQKKTQSMNVICTDAFDRHGRAKRARLDLSDTMAADIQSEYRYLQSGIASTSKHIGNFVDVVDNQVTSMTGLINTYGSSSSARLSSMQHTMKNLAAQGTKEDVPTGRTPRKHPFQYTDHWELTKSRDVLLSEWRKMHDSNGELAAANIPLREDEEDSPMNTLPTPEPLASPLPTIVSPPLASLASSLASDTSIPPVLPQPPQRPTLKPTSRKGGPTPLGTLTDRPTNTITTRTTRRAR